jgi:predicted ATP-dependent protease
MLRRDVVAAAENGQFHIYAVDHVDQAMAILTGVPAGEAGADGQYPMESINRRVAARVAGLSALRKAFAHPSEEKKMDRSH